MQVQDTLTQINNSTAMTNAEKAQSRKGTSTMDQDAFLQLMIAGMKNQDPLNPTSSKDLLAQQAQITQVNELLNLNKANQMIQGSNLIGREVQIKNNENPDQTIRGIVSEAKFNDRTTSIMVDGVEYPAKDILSIK